MSLSQDALAQVRTEAKRLERKYNLNVHTARDMWSEFYGASSFDHLKAEILAGDPVLIQAASCSSEDFLSEIPPSPRLTGQTNFPSSSSSEFSFDFIEKIKSPSLFQKFRPHYRRLRQHFAGSAPFTARLAMIRYAIECGPMPASSSEINAHPFFGKSDLFSEKKGFIGFPYMDAPLSPVSVQPSDVQVFNVLSVDDILARARDLVSKNYEHGFAHRFSMAAYSHIIPLIHRVHPSITKSGLDVMFELENLNSLRTKALEDERNASLVESLDRALFPIISMPLDELCRRGRNSSDSRRARDLYNRSVKDPSRAYNRFSLGIGTESAENGNHFPDLKAPTMIGFEQSYIERVVGALDKMDPEINLVFLDFEMLDLHRVSSFKKTAFHNGRLDATARCLINECRSRGVYPVFIFPMELIDQYGAPQPQNGESDWGKKS